MGSRVTRAMGAFLSLVPKGSYVDHRRSTGTSRTGWGPVVLGQRHGRIRNESGGTELRDQLTGSEKA